MQPGSDSQAFERTLSVLRRRLPLIAACVVVVAGAAYGFSKRQPAKYTASAALTFNSDPLSQQIAGLVGNVPNNSSTLLSQEASNVEAAKAGHVAATTAETIGHGLTEAGVIGSLSIAGQGESEIVVVSATDSAAQLSAAIANTYAQQVVKEQERLNHRYYRNALAVVRRQLNQLTPQQRVGADGLSLQNRVQTLSLLTELKSGNVEVSSEAAVPTSPSSPKTKSNTILGALIGLLIGLILAFTLERLGRRIASAEELEAIYQLPLLGAIPQSAGLSRKTSRGSVTAALSAEDAEAFNLVRARMRFFDIDRALRTIVVASAEPGEGKSMIARHLAEVAARFGSRVLLIEADLRHPSIAEHLGVEPGPGLADALIDGTPIAAMTQSVTLAEGGRTLDVLVAGVVLPPNPAEMLESGAANALLDQTRSAYDLVVIDTPPLIAVSDAFPLLTKADGIIVVGRVGRTRRHAAERLHQLLKLSGAPLLGVIANGSKVGSPSVYHYTRSDRPPASHARSNGASPSGEMSPPARV